MASEFEVHRFQETNCVTTLLPGLNSRCVTICKRPRNMSRFLPSTIHDRLKPIGNNRRVVHIAALVVAIYGFVIVADTLTSYSVGSFSFSAVAPKMPNKPVASVTFPERYKHDESCHVPTWAKVVTTKTTPSFKIAIYKTRAALFLNKLNRLVVGNRNCGREWCNI